MSGSVLVVKCKNRLVGSLLTFPEMYTNTETSVRGNLLTTLTRNDICSC